MAEDESIRKCGKLTSQTTVASFGNTTSMPFHVLRFCIISYLQAALSLGHFGHMSRWHEIAGSHLSGGETRRAKCYLPSEIDKPYRVHVHVIELGLQYISTRGFVTPFFSFIGVCLGMYLGLYSTYGGERCHCIYA